MQKRQKSKGNTSQGSSLVELLIVIGLFAFFIPVSINLLLGERKISAQSYIQHSAAQTMSETVDILRFMRNRDFELISNGSFYLTRNPGNNSWLVKSDLPEKEAFERYITVSNALRHQGNDRIYLDGDVGPSYEDPQTKRIEISVLWSPDYIPVDLLTQTLYLTDWQNTYTF